MLAIGIDTSLPRGSVALVDSNPTFLVITLPVPSAYCETLLPAIDRLLSQAGKTLADLDLLAVATGPGNFTGLRIGMATAKGLALALARPLAGISTLDAIARDCMAMPGQRPGTYCVLQEAGRGDLYRGLYGDAAGECVTMGAPSVVPWRSALAGLGGDTIIVADSDSPNLRILREESRVREPFWRDRPAIGGSLARMAIAAAGIHGTASIPMLVPNYLRPPDVEVRINPDSP